MHKSQLFKKLSETWNITEKDARLCVETLFESMADVLADGGRVEIRGFGSFKVKDYQPYKGRNPRTGKVVKVPKKRLPVFKTSSQLNKRINKSPKT